MDLSNLLAIYRRGTAGGLIAAVCTIGLPSGVLPVFAGTGPVDRGDPPEGGVLVPDFVQHDFTILSGQSSASIIAGTTLAPDAAQRLAGVRPGSPEAQAIMVSVACEFCTSVDLNTRPDMTTAERQASLALMGKITDHLCATTEADSAHQTGCCQSALRLQSALSRD